MNLKIATLLTCALILSNCGGSDGNNEIPPNNTDTDTPFVETADPTVDASVIAYNDLSVHDPSVIRTDDGTYYVFGSHLSAAKTTDLMTWERVADLVEDANPLFNTYETEIAEGIEWTGGYVGSWAADVIQLSDDRYYFYYSHCTNPDTGECDAPRSYLGVAVSDNIEGPYENLGIFLRSGMTDAEIADGYGPEGIDTYNAEIHPNVIDPDTFYDKDGNLWMTYGSYSGGIFILEMDESTGMPVPGQGYGTHIAGGDHSAIEGPYVLYSPESDYYYLFLSFGGFEAEDGYNIRVARSRNPDGPYLDAEGNDMVNARGSWENIEPYGVKIMGGHMWESHAGDSSVARGYLAPGHNSAYYNDATEEHLLVTHTRFPNSGQFHAIRVHEMFLTAGDWLVASPQRYAPIDGANDVDLVDVVGDYKVINHGKDINREAKETLYLTLNEDRTISGDWTGSYTLSADNPNHINIAINSVGSFSGTLAWQWNYTREQLLPTFSALSGEGGALWGSQLPELDATTVVQNIADALAYPDTFVGDSINLPTVGARGADIAWTSGNGNVIKTDGTVLRPAAGAGDATVMLTADISFKDASASEVFTITIPQRKQFNRIAQYDFEDSLGDTLGYFEDGSATGDRIFNTGSVAYAAGHDGQALQLDGANGVLLPEGLISNYEYTVSFWVNPVAHTQFTTTFFGAINEQVDDMDVPFSNQWISMVPMSWDENTMFWSGSEPWFDGITGQLIPTNEWSHLAFAVDNGVVTVMINGTQYFSGGLLTDFFTDNVGKFALGVNYWNDPLNGMIDELKIYEAALTPGEIQALDVDNLPVAELISSATDILDLGDISAVKEDLILPLTGPYASAISWVSSDPSVISIEANEGIVTRPPDGQPDAEVTLSATITLDDQQSTKDFTVTVSSLTPPVPSAHFAFEEDLTDSQGNFAAGTVTGNLINNTGGTVSYATGVVGQALSIDGTSGVRLADNLITDGSYSISMWLNPTVVTQYTTAFFGAVPNDVDSARWISVTPSGPASQLMLWIGTNWYDGTTGYEMEAGTWAHFVAVYNDGNLTLYVDGEQVFDAAGAPDQFTGVSPRYFSIGVNYWDTPYNGMMDELKIFDEAITAQDVNSLYNEGSSGE